MGSAVETTHVYITTMPDGEGGVANYIWLPDCPGVGTWAKLLPGTLGQPVRERVELWVELWFRSRRKRRNQGSWPELVDGWELIEVGPPGSPFEDPTRALG